jgi:hypothetical protein
MSQTSRNLNIQLCIRSLRELYQLTKSFRGKEKSEVFIVRFGMMKSLAKDALAYSLKVSYLDERREYKIIADILDNIYILISRSELRRIARKYEDIVLCKFDAMYEVLGMIDERLKTVHIVSNRYVKKRAAPITNAGLAEPEEEEEVRTNHLKHIVRAYAKDRELQEFISYMNTKFADLTYLNSNNVPGLTPCDSLSRKLAVICDVFNYIRNKADYIATTSAFHKTTRSGFSFIQQAIRKCPYLIDSINKVYDNIRDSVMRIDPELRREKRNTIDLLKTVQDILCKHYIANPSDKSVESLLKKPE